MSEKYESKSIQFKVDETGKVSARIATFGVVDRDYDIVEASAFKDGQEVAMVWSHNWASPIGKGVIRVLQNEAVYEGAFFMDTTAGQEAYKTVKAMDALQEWSWGFLPIKATWEERDGRTIRHLVETEVFEVSPVLKGAGVGTRTMGIKGRQSLEAEITAVTEAANSLGERVRSLKGLREDQGREISAERCEEVKKLAGELRKTADALLTPGENPDDAGRKAARVEYNRFLKIEARLNGVGED